MDFFHTQLSWYHVCFIANGEVINSIMTAIQANVFRCFIKTFKRQINNKAVFLSASNKVIKPTFIFLYFFIFFFTDKTIEYGYFLWIRVHFIYWNDITIIVMKDIITNLFARICQIINHMFVLALFDIFRHKDTACHKTASVPSTCDTINLSCLHQKG